MAERNIGKITQIIGAVLDVKYAEGQLPEINEEMCIRDRHNCIWNSGTDHLSGRDG